MDPPQPSERAGSRTLLDQVLIILVHSHVVRCMISMISRMALENQPVLPPKFQSLGRDPLDERNFPFYLDIGFLQFPTQIRSNILAGTVRHRNSNGGSDMPQFLLVPDPEVLDVPLHKIPENLENAHSVVCVGRSSTGHHPGKVPSLDRVDSGPAHAHLRIGVPGAQSAWTHETMLATCRFGPNGTGPHVRRPGEGSLRAVRGCFLEHLNGCLTRAQFSKIQLPGLPFLTRHDTPLFPSAGSRKTCKNPDPRTSSPATPFSGYNP